MTIVPHSGSVIIRLESRPDQPDARRFRREPFVDSSGDIGFGAKTMQHRAPVSPAGQIGA